jgi:hypothetical protein
MQDSDREIVRHVLSSILDRLGESAQGRGQIAGGDNPIILVVMGQGASTITAKAVEAGDEKSASVLSAAPLTDDSAKGFERRAIHAAHPVLEKFTVVKEETASAAPKSCFMEPGRVCVNSGACQMRGY